MSDYETVGYEVDAGVATITLKRPDKHNAFSPTMIAEVEDVWQRLRMDDDVRVGIVTGAGDRAFTVEAVWTAKYVNIHQALQNGPTLINLIDSTSGISECADARRRERVEPLVR